MHREKSHSKLIALIFVIVGAPLLVGIVESLQSRPFTPDPRYSAIPVMPTALRTKNDTSSPSNTAKTTAEVQSSSTADDSHVTSPQTQTSRQSADALVADFYARHTVMPKIPWTYHHEGLRKSLYEIAYVVLSGDEAPTTLLRLLNDADKNVRITAFQALGDAQNALMEGGHGALVHLWARLSEQEMDSVIAAAVETLVHETREGELSNVQILLHSMGEQARPAVPYLIWASDNHPSADMRMWTMNMAWVIDPNSNATREVVRRRLADPNFWVRLEALQTTALRTVAGIIGPPRLPSAGDSERKRL